MTRISRGNPELDFRRQVIDLADLYGWEHVGFRPAKTEDGWRTPGTGTMASGWPDLTLVRPRDGRLIFAELKSDTGRLSPDQERVLATLRGVASAAPVFVEVHVWRPRDFELVKATLQ